MRIENQLALIVMLAVASTPVLSGGISSGLVSNVLMLPDQDLVFFSAGGAAAHVNKPSCATNPTGTWAIDISTGGGKAAMATVLTARAAEIPLTVEGYGTGVCTRESSREDVRFLYTAD